MTEKEINLKSILFLVIGILLLLSLVICIYIVNGERDLISVEAKVIDVKKDETGTGKNDITVSYDIDGTSYNYNFYYKDNINVNDKIDVYYHAKNKNSVTTYKTSRLIFICPIIGLFLCVLSLFELFRQNKNDDEIFQTSVIDISGTTQKLEIVTDNTVIKEYECLPEEQVETEVKAIKKEDLPILKEDLPKTKKNKEERKKESDSTPEKDDWYIEVKEDNQENQKNIPLKDTQKPSNSDLNKIKKTELKKEENKESSKEQKS